MAGPCDHRRNDRDSQIGVGTVGATGGLRVQRQSPCAWNADRTEVPEGASEHVTRILYRAERSPPGCVRAGESGEVLLESYARRGRPFSASNDARNERREAAVHDQSAE